MYNYCGGEFIWQLTDIEELGGMKLTMVKYGFLPR